MNCKLKILKVSWEYIFLKMVLQDLNGFVPNKQEGYIVP